MTLVQSLLNGNKILCCSNGTSAANAQHFAARMINRFEIERPSLPASALNADTVVLTAPLFFPLEHQIPDAMSQPLAA
jgi:DnaA initiator-associating protein